MKIAFIGQKGLPAHGGGVERYVEDIATRLVGTHCVPIVYTRPNYTPADLKDHKGVQLVSLPSLPTKHLDAISHTFVSTIHAAFSGVNVIHYQSIGPALLAWLPKVLNRRIKIVSTLQSRDYEHLKWGAFARFMLRLGERIMCRFSDEVLVVKPSMREYVRDTYGVEANVIPNGANLYEAISDTSQLAAWGLQKGEYIVAISRLIRHKGLGYLVEAYSRLSTDKKLVIVGEGSFTDEYVAELKAMAQGNPNIIFTGGQSGEVLAQLYAHAYIFVQPSESEGLSLALLEAMARAKAVLASDIPANTEAVADAGLIFKNKDVVDLHAKLEFALANSDHLTELSRKARRRIESHYNWDMIVPSIVATYGGGAETADEVASVSPAV